MARPKIIVAYFLFYFIYLFYKMDTNVYTDQKTFNKAVKKAIDHLDDDDKDTNQTARMIVTLIMLSFYFWALLLALKVSDSQHRVLHIILALFTGPIYVLAYYLGMMEGMEGMGMSGMSGMSGLKRMTTASPGRDGF